MKPNELEGCAYLALATSGREAWIAHVLTGTEGNAAQAVALWPSWKARA